MNIKLKKARLILLAPFGVIYGVVAWLRRKFHTKPFIPKTPTICIGNIAVGGTGKTPLTEYLIRLLAEENVAVLSRGYGRKTKGFLITTGGEIEVTAETFGDEPTQMHQKFPQIPIAVCEKRKIGIEKLEKGIAPRVILLDDAFQHVQVQCGKKILLAEYARPYWRDFPMPAGNLREFACAAQTADIIIVSKCPKTITEEDTAKFQQSMRLTASQRCYFSAIAYNKITAANRIAHQTNPTSETPVFLLTGIANPKPLYNHVKMLFENVTTFEFSDHHNFNKTEIQRLCQKMAESKEKSILITTEKDWMRLQNTEIEEFLKQIPIFVVPIHIEFLFNKEVEFRQEISNYLLESGD